MNNPFSLEDKLILVTGASSGIGKATALECARLGAKLIITGRNRQRLEETFASLVGKGHSMHVLDINKEEEVKELVSVLESVDGIVHAAGIACKIPFQFATRKKIDPVFETNFFAPVNLSQKIIKSKKIKNGGSVVFISSIDGPFTAHIGNSIYAASKGALSAIMKGMAVELAGKKIRVNAILPGMIDTPLIYGESLTEEQLHEESKLYPLGRFGRPEEIAYAAIYFLSEASSFTTGTELIVDGGFTLL